MKPQKKKPLPSPRARRRPPPAPVASLLPPPAPLIPEKTSGNGDRHSPGPGISVADPGELAAVAAAIREAEGTPADRAPIGEAVVEAAEALAEGKVDAGALALLTAEEIGDVFSLAFALASDRRGPHWELAPKSAGRIGKWVKLSLERHGAQWLEKWLPEIMAGMLIAYELGLRLREDRRLGSAQVPTL